MKRETRDTEWVTSDGVGRRVIMAPGYDCRVRCEHEQKGDHGQHGDEYLLAVRRNGREALTLTVFTFIRDGKAHPVPGIPRLVTPANLSLHTAYPTRDDDIREGGRGGECALVDGGRCFAGWSSSLQADGMWRSDERALEASLFLGPAPESRLLDLRTGVWQRLVDHLDVIVPGERANGERHQCAKCGGTGIVAGSS